MSAANGALAMPYPGLRPFEDEDQPLFFGREAQISAMLRQLEDHRFVAVVGSSGSGKSSLVRAGLLPAVREGFLLGTTDWLTIIIKPGHQPYQRLVRALSVATSGTEGAKIVPAWDDPLMPDETTTLAMLRRTDRGLLIALDQLAISPASRVMVVVDQFEELFAFRRAGVNRDIVASRDEAAAFVSMLMRSASESAGRVWAILTMRSDFIGDCEAFLGLPEQISHSQFLVPRLDRGQMEEAIVRPADVKEGTFKIFTFEEGLVNRIINDAGDRPDQLPLMQHALMRTWKHAVARTGASGPLTVMPEDYEAAGGIEMALSLHANAAWDEIKDDPKKAHIARRLFLLLCDISPDGQITRRRPQVAEVHGVTGASVAEIEQVVRIFQQDDRNFLLPPPPLTAESYLDISHEALLRQWRLFAGEWQEEERQDACELRRLADLASLHKQGQGGSLAAEDLERIDRWKRRVSAEWGHRYVTNEEWEEALSFVEDSRAEVKREEEQRQKQARYKRALVRVVALILLAATGVSVWLMKNANEAKAAAQEALTRSFVRTIGVSPFGTPQPDEQAALWELAELDPANVSVRERVIDHWFGSEEHVSRALNRQMVGLHAAVGLNLALRKHSASKADEMADRLAKDLENPQQTNTNRLKLGQALASLTTRMEPKGTAGVSSRGAQVLAKTLEDPKTGAYQLFPLGKALAALAARMEAKEAAGFSSRGAQVLAEALDPQKTNKYSIFVGVDQRDYQLSTLGKALAALATRMEAKEAAGVSSRGARALAKALEGPHETNNPNMYALDDALAMLATRMEPKDAASVADGLAKGLEDPKTSASQLPALSKALAALATRMEPKDAAPFADSLAKVLEDDPKISAYQLAPLSMALAALAARMEPNDVASVADGLAKGLEDPKTSAYQLPALSKALTALATRMEPKDAAPFADRLAKGLEDSKTSAYQLAPLSMALAPLVARMDAREAASVASRGAQVLAKALEDPKTESNQLLRLSNALAALATRMEAKEAASVSSRGAQVLAKLLEDPRTESNQLLGLSNALAALTARLEAKEAASVSSRGAQVLAKLLEDPRTESNQLLGLSNALAALTARLEAKEAASVSSRGAQVLAKALEDPRTESNQLLGLSNALAALTARLDAKDGASVSSRGAQVLAKALEDPRTESNQLSGLSDALVALATRMEPKQVASVADSLAKALDNPQENDAGRMSQLESALGRLSLGVPSARQTRCLALSMILLNEALEAPQLPELEEAKRRKQLADLCALIDPQDLAEVLKWPFSVGEAEKITLAELEKKTGHKFGGDIWKFVEQAPSLGIKNVDGPAKRPKVEDARKELESIAMGSEVPGPPGGMTHGRKPHIIALIGSDSLPFGAAFWSVLHTLLCVTGLTTFWVAS